MGQPHGHVVPELDALTDEYVSNPDPVRQEELNQEIQDILGREPALYLADVTRRQFRLQAGRLRWLGIRQGNGNHDRLVVSPTEASQ